MGMNDYLICEYELPDPEAQAFKFQTKIRCECASYTITKDGRLFYKRAKYFDESQEVVEEQYHGDIYFSKLMGVLPDGQIVEIAGHGEYLDTRGENGEELRVEELHYDYVARFSYGRLDYVKRIG